GENTVTVDSGGVVNTRTDTEGNMGLWVAEGRAAVSTKDGVREAAAGTALSLTQDGEEEGLPMTALLSPRPAARLISREASGLSVEFVFQPVNYDGQFTRLEISASRNFENIEMARSLEDHRTVVSLPPGIWWWRAYPARPGQEEVPASAAAGKLTIVYALPPVLLTPADGQVFPFKPEYPTVRFRWNEGSEENAASYYLLEVADNPALENPRLNTLVRGSSAQYSQLEPGLWYWRITPGFPAGYEGSPSASPVFSFTIERSDVLPSPSPMTPAPSAPPAAAPSFSERLPEAAAPVLLVQPADNFVFQAEHFSGDTGITFQWSAVAGAGGYTFNLLQGGGERRRILSVPVSENSYTLRDLKILSRGPFLWQVTSDSRVLTENRFTIDIPEIKRIPLRDIGTVFSIRRSADENILQRISWFHDEGASLYELVLERKDGEDYREVTRKATKNSHIEVPVERGAYRYKLRIYNLLGQFEYETNWASFTIILA
ncbi:MAG: hypothetical protein LBT68_07780, partial [Spirochaetales bacterium]|nr:hypothetical protein [Spirochaetales bacterium]